MRTLALVAALVSSSLAFPSPPLGSEDPPARALAAELAAEPRLSGTSGALRGAKVVERHLEAAGLRVEIDERVVLLSLPRRLSVQVFADSASAQPLAGSVERFDPDAIPPGDVPLYSAWSSSGKVRAQVVDVGHGLAADYERLKAAKVAVKGKIALARYGRAYRGDKARLAEQHGCAGLLLYSDPKSDGGEKGDVWPLGPWKPDWDGQRGSILALDGAPGDPSTPLGPSPRPGESGERLSGDVLEARLPGIPCLPIGVRHVRAIQARLAPDERGAPLGPGPAEVELDLDVPRELRTIRNVIATLPGESDEFVIAGSHRDAWVRGAQDSGTGCVALLRAAQHLAERARAGWKPRATIRIAFWDAEEHGLIGSTEWAEANAAVLRERCLAYVNSDASVSGTEFSASGSPGMLGVLRSVAERARTADGARSLWEDWCARSEHGTPQLGLPGAGSDHAAFVHHLCIPMLEAGFGGNEGGQYHTRFDDFAFVERYLDPGFVGHEMLGSFLADLLAELASRPGGGFDVAEAARTFAGHARAAADQKAIPPEPGEELALAFERCAAAAAERTWSAADRPHRFYAELEPVSGIQGREWFRNALWAPSPDNGYASETFPVLRWWSARSLPDAVSYSRGLVAQIEGAAAGLAAAGAGTGAQPTGQ